MARLLQNIDKPQDLHELSDEELLFLECDGADAARARQALAARLQGLAAAAGALSDRLSLRHFSHISLDSQALAT